MTRSVSMTRRSLASLALVAAALLVLVAALSAVLWSVLAPDPQLIGPTRWLQAWHTFA